MSETIKDNVLDERYEVQIVIPQQMPHEPLPGEVLVNAPNNFSVLTNDQKKASQSSQKEERKEEENKVDEENEEEENKVNDEETRKRFKHLHEAALEGDWSKAEQILKNHPDDVRAKLSDLQDTVLHVAVTESQSCFVNKLMESNYLKENDLEMKNNEGNTAFSIAAKLGNKELAKSMFNKNHHLAMIRCGRGMLPVHVAAKLGDKNMLSFLYPRTEDYLDEEDRIELLVRLIDNDLYDVAYSMVDKFSDLAVSRVKVDKNKNGRIGETALHALARKPLKFYDFDKSKQGILKRYYYQFSRTNKLQNKRMHPKALELVQLLWNKVVDQLDYCEILKLISEPQVLMFDAAKEGNMDFLSIITSKHPNLVLRLDGKNYSIFHTAVSYRHENIFDELIDKRPSIKNVIVSLEVGEEKDSILHLAAKLPPDQSRLKTVTGAALQMTRELWWFKNVSKIMPPRYVEAKNAKGKTASTLFTESHTSLMKKGEDWMKKTAESCMLVATLIATVVFAAAFTLPGGLNDDAGTPHFVRKASFISFAIWDTVSLVSSACSILTFLSILTARYAEEDFLWFLPAMLLVGLFTLFLSIIGMMAVFCTTLFIVFVEGTIAPVVLGNALAPIPIMLFIYQQIPLVIDTLRTNKSLFPKNFNIIEGEGIKRGA